MTSSPRPEPPVRPGWAPFLVPGERVVVRHAIDREREGVGFTDALGHIEAVDENTVTVATKRGPRRVPRALISAAKQVPPPPRRSRPDVRR